MRSDPEFVEGRGFRYRVCWCGSLGDDCTDYPEEAGVILVGEPTQEPAPNLMDAFFYNFSINLWKSWNFCFCYENAAPRAPAQETLIFL